MFLKVGPGAGGTYWYYPSDSLGALLDPQEKAAAVYNNSGKWTKTIGALLLLTGLVWAADGDWGDQVTLYGAGACGAVGFI
jgi:hypothetical protein